MCFSAWFWCRTGRGRKRMIKSLIYIKLGGKVLINKALPLFFLYSLSYNTTHKTSRINGNVYPKIYPNANLTFTPYYF